ncbi:hypothetical protein K493DRAFT_320274 [Basidiobolus meristosporus CBS 931.73]|uniref:Nucleotide-diphospho-sugar transferase domain-containing protein n=1 Tax=Basidiobolus meristosporus CBS 931.73 TaxID=1314790 RepID=A0A1Y1XC53_9FUNG|nr:hypothetical protein K493DRAFT_320274 [Basidiobolus meristosporus CBS 931.73]|eukprot:ORX83305.1 hypothetical protein K493DRAFT_320274 [Basidiobolus meristosporus CBS 931.73]
MANPLLDKVHVLVESKDLPLPSFAIHTPKTREAVVTKRPMMADYFDVVFANSDIFFDTSIEYFTMISDTIFDSTFYAISRWHYKKEEGMITQPYPGLGSYDTFVFKPQTICSNKAKLQDLLSNLNYTLGVLGAENRLLYELKRLYPELKQENPVHRVRTVHIHDSNVRKPEWWNRVTGDDNSKNAVILDY